MPAIGLGLHFLFAILFAIHAVRNGHDRYWLFVLFMFPVLGSLVYAGAVWLPGLRHDRTARRLARGLRDRLDPGRELREAEEAFMHSATVDNRLRLADALAAAGRAGDAVGVYHDALKGLHADDPGIQVRLAAAQFDSGDAAGAARTLEALIAVHPDFRSPDGHLTYARALAAAGERDKARIEFDALARYYAGLEARARYAEILQGWGEADAARQLAANALRDERRMPAYARRANREWTERLKRIHAGA